MSKLSKVLIQEYHFIPQNKSLQGNINGFEISVYDKPMEMPPAGVLVAAFIGDKVPLVRDYVDANRKNFGIISFEVYNNGVVCRLSAVSYNKLAQKCGVLMTSLTNFLISIGCPNSTHCPSCGNELVDAKSVNVDKFIYTACGNCHETLANQRKASDVEFAATPKNYLKGLIGALGGALLGAIAWIIVYLIGFMSAFVAILIAFLASLGYDLMKGRKDKVKAVIVAGSTLVVVALTTFFIYVLMAAAEVASGNASGSPLSAFFDLMSNEAEFSSAFTYDILMGLLFGAIGAGIFISGMIKKQKRY